MKMTNSNLKMMKERWILFGHETCQRLDLETIDKGKNCQQKLFMAIFLQEITAFLMKIFINPLK